MCIYTNTHNYMYIYIHTYSWCFHPPQWWALETIFRGTKKYVRTQEPKVKKLYPTKHGNQPVITKTATQQSNKGNLQLMLRRNSTDYRPPTARVTRQPSRIWVDTQLSFYVQKVRKDWYNDFSNAKHEKWVEHDQKMADERLKTLWSPSLQSC